MRKVFLDYDARREPKTDRYCMLSIVILMCVWALAEAFLASIQ